MTDAVTTEITLPVLSPALEEATIAKWHVKPGDALHRGDLIAEIETDKATLDLEAVDDGIIDSILIPEGTEGVPVGTVIAMLVKEDAQPSTQLSAPESQPVHTAEVSVPSRASADTTAHERRHIKASPLVRRLAREKNVDLSVIHGSGPGGRIVRVDVQGASSDVQQAQKARVQEIEHSSIPLTTMRKTIARRMVDSKTSIPHAYLAVDVAVDDALELRSELNAGLAEPIGKLSLNDLLIKAMALALRRTPDANVQFSAQKLLQLNSVDLSVAVSVNNGLVTPVVRDADRKNLLEIAAEMKQLIERSRSNRLMPEDLRGGSATLSNLGMYGIKQFQAIINPPQALILTVGAAEPRAVVVGDGAVDVATMMTATASFDHRAMDGVACARLLAAFKEVLQRPSRLTE